MHETANATAVGICISIGISLLAGSASVFAATRSHGAGFGKAVPVLFGIALVLTVLNTIAAALIAVGGMAYLALLKATLLFTAAFAIAGMVLGLMRNLRSSKAVKALRA